MKQKKRGFMKKTLILLLVFIFMFTSCSSNNGQNTFENSIWDELNGKEWSSSYGFAGEGYYFYEDNRMAMCMFMVYGSGVPIIHDSHSKVLIDDEGKIVVSIMFDATKDDVEIDLELIDGKLYHGDKVYLHTLDRDPRTYINGD